MVRRVIQLRYHTIGNTHWTGITATFIIVGKLSGEQRSHIDHFHCHRLAATKDTS